MSSSAPKNVIGLIGMWPDTRGQRMPEGHFEPEGKLSQHLKDVDLLEVGHAAGAPLMVTTLHPPAPARGSRGRTE